VKFLQKRWLAAIALGIGGAALAGAALAQSAPHGDAQGRIAALASEVEQDVRHVKHLQEISRKQRDIIKLTCVNDRMVELKAQANIFDSSRHEVELVSGPNGGANGALFEDMQNAAHAVHRARAEADACVGEPELYGESVNGFTSPTFPDDPTLGNPFGPIIEPPGYASPFN
jgi:hypothetical protein